MPLHALPTAFVSRERLLAAVLGSTMSSLLSFFPSTAFKFNIYFLSYCTFAFVGCFLLTLHCVVASITAV